MKANLTLAAQEGKLNYILSQLYALTTEEKCYIADNLCDELEIELNEVIKLPSKILVVTDNLSSQFKENGK